MGKLINSFFMDLQKVTPTLTFQLPTPTCPNINPKYIPEKSFKETDSSKVLIMEQRLLERGGKPEEFLEADITGS